MAQTRETPSTAARLEAAERLCASRGVRLTSLRRRVLEILLDVGEPVKAYDLLDAMRGTGKRITPATVYRSLEFLLEQGLSHRVNALNAYMACTDECERHYLFILVCSLCRKTKELNDSALYATLTGRLRELGFPLAGESIEVQGLCPDCSPPLATQ